MSEVPNGSSLEVTRRSFLRTATTVASASSPISQAVRRLLTNAAAPSLVVSAVEQVLPNTAVVASEVIYPPVYKNELVRRSLEMDYGSWVTGSEPIDTAMREQLNSRYAERSNNYHFAYVAIDHMPDGKIKDEYSRAFDSDTIEPDEMDLLIQQGRMQDTDTSEGQHVSELDRALASDIFFQNLGDANAQEIIYRSRLSRADIIRKWAALPRSKPVPAAFVTEKLDAIDRTSAAEEDSSIAASFSGQDLYTHSYSQTFLETLEDEKVINAVRPIFPAVDDERWEYAPEVQLAHATEIQIDQLAAMLADSTSVLHQKYVKYSRAFLQDDLDFWTHDGNAHAQKQKEDLKTKEEKVESKEILAQLVAAFGVPARSILAQIDQIVQMREREG